MRNWKYINGAEGVKIGNEKTQNTWTIQDARRNYDAAKKEFDEKGDLFSKRKLDEVKSIIDKEYYAAYKRLEELERKKNDNLYNKGGTGEIPYYNEAKQNYAHWGLLRETIGNDTPAEYAKRPPKIVGGNSLPEELEKDVEKKDKEKVEDIDELKKTGNKKYTIKHSSGHDGGYDYGYIVVDESNKSVGRTFSTRSEAEEYMQELYKKEKVGNARYTTREDVISHLDTDLYDIHQKLKDKNAPSMAYASELLKKGYDYATLSKYNKKIGEIIDRYKAGNNKVGNRQKYDTGDEVTVTLPGRGPRRALVVRDEGNVIKVAFSENGPEVTALPSEVSNKKVGNSSSDDKFAYVMREFEEGKLKTPDGKVVTDPAQAKAIAYSESKKTENGLARARNAIKK